jgi:hypothetical protein
MAYTPIEPLPSYGSPLLKGATEGLTYIRQVNEAKRQEAQKRQDEIVKLLGDVDFPTAVNMQNKKMQVYLRQAAEDSIMKILSKSAKRGGMVTAEERMEADRVVKTLENELAAITQGEKEFTSTMETTAKQPGKFTPESLKEYSDNYIRTGESKTDILQLSPVAFSVMQNKALELYDERIEEKERLVGENMVTVKESNLTDAEKKEAYKYLASQEPGYGVWEKQQFGTLPPEEQTKYLQMTNGNVDKAARNWGVDNYAQDLIPSSKSSEVAPQSKLKGDSKITSVEPTVTPEEGKTWILDGKKISQNVVTLDGEKVTLKDALMTKIGTDQKTGTPYLEVVVNVKGTGTEPESTGDKQTDALNMIMYKLTGGGSAVKSYKIPYNSYKQYINSKYRLEGIDELEKQQPQGLKKIEW